MNKIDLDHHQASSQAPNKGEEIYYFRKTVSLFLALIPFMFCFSLRRNC